MSTRYVWEKFEKAEGYATVEKKGETLVMLGKATTTAQYPLCGQGYEISQDGEFSLTGQLGRLIDTVETSKRKYVLPNDRTYVFSADNTSNGVNWVYNNSNGALSIATGDAGGANTFSRLSVGEWGTIPGSSLGNVSSGSSTTYPKDGVSGNYWYTYKGSDNIDPKSIQMSKTSELETGDSITISVTKRSPIYGGTVYYQYQYSTNGGTTWTNIGSKTTATSKTITIPEGAEQFQARVQASDGWGFTSSTYVAGPNLPVSQIKAYATVGGKNRAGAKLYATVGGKIRQVQKGYATVGGKIKKLF